jgi:hypothetical protein
MRSWNRRESPRQVQPPVPREPRIERHVYRSRSDLPMVNLVYASDVYSYRRDELPLDELFADLPGELLDVLGFRVPAHATRTNSSSTTTRSLFDAPISSKTSMSSFANPS